LVCRGVRCAAPLHDYVHCVVLACCGSERLQDVSEVALMKQIESCRGSSIWGVTVLHNSNNRRDQPTRARSILGLHNGGSSENLLVLNGPRVWSKMTKTVHRLRRKARSDQTVGGIAESGCPFWTHIEPCAVPRGPIFNNSWRVSGSYAWLRRKPICRHSVKIGRNSPRGDPAAARHRPIGARGIELKAFRLVSTTFQSPAERAASSFQMDLYVPLQMLRRLQLGLTTDSL